MRGRSERRIRRVEEKWKMEEEKWRRGKKRSKIRCEGLNFKNMRIREVEEKKDQKK